MKLSNEMNEISVGAVGAASIAGLVSLLGLVIGKEQKISEFRQKWIDDLRGCFASYIMNINAISDIIRSKAGGNEINLALIERYRCLNEASNGIILRVNSSELPAKILLKSMKDFEQLASKNSNLTPERIRSIEESFIDSAKNLLKFEWKRVKRGEPVFVWTKYILLTITFVMICAFVTMWIDLGEGRLLDIGISSDSPAVRTELKWSDQHSISPNEPVVSVK